MTSGAQVLDVSSDSELLDALRRDPTIEVLDERATQRAGLMKSLPTPTDDELAEPDRWVYYPWRRTLVGILGPRAFRRLRLDRNRNKITWAEQVELGKLRIGVVGLSVGHAIAHTLAMEGIGAQLRLADFDEVELSNLNRIPGSLLDLGVNKAIVAARRIAEIDPYVDVMVETRGFTPESADEFMDGLDIVIEECDSLDVKLMVREAARARRIPLVMETSDRGLLDIERFDLEPDRPIFHGLLGNVESASLAGLSSRDKIPYVLATIEPKLMSARMAASMIEVDESITTWPQLGGDVLLGGASVAAAVRRIGLGQPLASGRVRIDLDEQLDSIAEPTAVVTEAGGVVQAQASDNVILDAIARAPSGGNVQPWHASIDGDTVTIAIREDRTSTLDIRFRGSYTAVGAALHNAQVAAEYVGKVGVASIHDSRVELTLTNGSVVSEDLDFEAMMNRHTNRNYGVAQTIEPAVIESLHAAAESESARLICITDRLVLSAAAYILSAADRIRYLTPGLHADLISELRWPGDENPDTGIDVLTLGMDDTDLIKLDVVRRREVMELLTKWDKGNGLGSDTRDRIESCSALAVVVIDGNKPDDYIKGGSAVCRVWIEAEKSGLAVQPMSPTFIYATEPDDFTELSENFSEYLEQLRTEFLELIGVDAGEALSLVMRLSHALPVDIKSRRLPVSFNIKGSVGGLRPSNGGS